MHIPFALWILAGLVALAAFMAFILIMRKKGAKKYGLSFFKSIPFALLITGAAFFGVVAVLVRLFPKMLDASNYPIAQFTCVLTVLVALVLNIRRSTIPFGVLYTIAQMLAAYTFILALLGITVWKKIDD